MAARSGKSTFSGANRASGQATPWPPDIYSTFEPIQPQLREDQKTGGNGSRYLGRCGRALWHDAMGEDLKGREARKDRECLANIAVSPAESTSNDIDITPPKPYNATSLALLCHV